VTILADAKAAFARKPRKVAKPAESSFAEFAVTTNFSFLRGASHPEELVAQALALGLQGLGIADRNSLAGVVRAHLYLRDNADAAHGFKLAIGVRLVFCDGTPDVLAFPRDHAAYSRLTRLLTRGNLKAQKGFCLLTRDDLLESAQGLQLIVMQASTWEEEDTNKRAVRSYDEFAPPSCETRAQDESACAFLYSLKEATQGRVWLAAAMTYGPAMRQEFAERAALARAENLPLIATNDVLMHAAARRPLQDVITAIRKGIPLDCMGRRLEANAERHLKNGAEMARLFVEVPKAVSETMRFLDGLSFSLNDLAHQYPEELREGFGTPQEALEVFSREGAARRYPNGVPEKVRQALAHELKLVEALGYAPYFLTVHDIVRFARAQEILCQGRGSAANSVLCFCLGITEVDPAVHDLLFERFISAERQEPPDIDVDFEHERREEVMQYIYARYGRARAGLTATVITYRSRSAMREVGKVFGLSEDVVSALSSDIWGRSSEIVSDDALRRLGLDPADARLRKALVLASELIGFPRHLSQHTGGFVITRGRLDETVPIANAAMDERTTVEWDKDDLDALGILKVDILALGMLTCLRKGFELLETHYGKHYTLANVPSEERAVYAMISRADTIGVFQIESRAQMSMLPRLRPQVFYDLVIEVAIVRPGPIQGDMVHPYLRRRQNLEPAIYPSKELEAVLGKTLGVPLFQEQAMKIAIVAAGFTPAEADKLRRAMATFKRTGMIGKFRDKMINGMVARNYTREFAERCFRQIEGFGTYGFPESHAASFALLVYVSAWMKCRYPDVFACALLNAQPMGFYAPAQIVRDAREHGIAIEEIDVNFSEWDCSLNRDAPQEAPAGECIKPGRDAEMGGSSPGVSRLHSRHITMQGEIFSTYKIRLGFRQIKGLAKKDVDALVAKRAKGYDSIRDLWLRTGLAPSVLAALAEADAFRSLGLDRRDALWAVRGLNRAGDKDDLPLLKTLSFHATEPDAQLAPMPLGEHVVEDYRHLSLSLKAHPVSFLRDRLAARQILRAEDLSNVASGKRVTVAGLVLVRQRPGSASGVIFLTMEDETGVANTIIWPKVFERLRPIVLGARFIAVTGRLQAESDVIHIIAEKAEDLTPMLGFLVQENAEKAKDISVLARADAVKRPQQGSRFPLSAQKGRHSIPAKSTAEPQLFDSAPATESLKPLARVWPKGRSFH
jgi:error-prone DNA polymerase